MTSEQSLRLRSADLRDRVRAYARRLTDYFSRDLSRMSGSGIPLNFGDRISLLLEPSRVAPAASSDKTGFAVGDPPKALEDLVFLKRFLGTEKRPLLLLGPYGGGKSVLLAELARSFAELLGDESYYPAGSVPPVIPLPIRLADWVTSSCPTFGQFVRETPGRLLGPDFAFDSDDAALLLETAIFFPLFDGFDELPLFDPSTAKTGVSRQHVLSDIHLFAGRFHLLTSRPLAGAEASYEVSSLFSIKPLLRSHVRPFVVKRVEKSAAFRGITASAEEFADRELNLTAAVTDWLDRPLFLAAWVDRLISLPSTPPRTASDITSAVLSELFDRGRARGIFAPGQWGAMTHAIGAVLFPCADAGFGVPIPESSLQKSLAETGGESDLKLPDGHSLASLCDALVKSGILIRTFGMCFVSASLVSEYLVASYLAWLASADSATELARPRRFWRVFRAWFYRAGDYPSLLTYLFEQLWGGNLIQRSAAEAAVCWVLGVNGACIESADWATPVSPPLMETDRQPLTLGGTILQSLLPPISVPASVGQTVSSFALATVNQLIELFVERWRRPQEQFRHQRPAPMRTLSNLPRQWARLMFVQMITLLRERGSGLERGAVDALGMLVTKLGPDDLGPSASELTSVLGLFSDPEVQRQIGELVGSTLARMPLPQMRRSVCEIWNRSANGASDMGRAGICSNLADRLTELFPPTSIESSDVAEFLLGRAVDESMEPLWCRVKDLIRQSRNPPAEIPSNVFKDLLAVYDSPTHPLAVAAASLASARLCHDRLSCVGNVFVIVGFFSDLPASALVDSAGNLVSEPKQGVALFDRMLTRLRETELPFFQSTSYVDAVSYMAIEGQDLETVDEINRLLLNFLTSSAEQISHRLAERICFRYRIVPLPVGQKLARNLKIFMDDGELSGVAQSLAFSLAWSRPENRLQEAVADEVISDLFTEIGDQISDQQRMLFEYALFTASFASARRVLEFIDAKLSKESSGTEGDAVISSAVEYAATRRLPRAEAIARADSWARIGRLTIAERASSVIDRTSFFVRSVGLSGKRPIVQYGFSGWEDPELLFDPGLVFAAREIRELLSDAAPMNPSPAAGAAPAVDLLTARRQWAAIASALGEAVNLAEIRSNRRSDTFLPEIHSELRNRGFRLGEVSNVKEKGESKVVRSEFLRALETEDIKRMIIRLLTRPVLPSNVLYCRNCGWTIHRNDAVGPNGSSAPLRCELCPRELRKPLVDDLSAAPASHQLNSCPRCYRLFLHDRDIQKWTNRKRKGGFCPNPSCESVSLMPAGRIVEPKRVVPKTPK